MSGTASNRISLSAQDIIDIAKVVETEADARLRRSNPQLYDEQVRAVTDVIMNRVASPAYPNTVRGVLNARNQFTKINGPTSYVAQNGQRVNVNPYGSVQNTPMPREALQNTVNNYVSDRQSGAVGDMTGGALNFGVPELSSANNSASVGANTQLQLGTIAFNNRGNTPNVSAEFVGSRTNPVVASSLSVLERFSAPTPRPRLDRGPELAYAAPTPRPRISRDSQESGNPHTPHNNLVPPSPAARISRTAGRKEPSGAVYVGGDYELGISSTQRPPRPHERPTRNAPEIMHPHPATRSGESTPSLSKSTAWSGYTGGDYSLATGGNLAPPTPQVYTGGNRRQATTEVVEYGTLPTAPVAAETRDGGSSGLLSSLLGSLGNKAAGFAANSLGTMKDINEQMAPLKNPLVRIGLSVMNDFQQVGNRLSATRTAIRNAGSAQDVENIIRNNVNGNNASASSGRPLTQYQINRQARGGLSIQEYRDQVDPNYAMGGAGNNHNRNTSPTPVHAPHD